MEPLTMSSIPGYNECHSSSSNQKIVLSVNQKEGDKVIRKKNQIEEAKDKLIDWIKKCNAFNIIFI